MKTCTKCGETKPISLFGAHATGLRRECKVCRNQYHKNYYLKNAEKAAAANLDWRLQNADHLIAYRKVRYARVAEQAKRAAVEWRKANPDLRTYYNAKRRVLQKHSIPPWADHAKIREVYAKARAIRDLGVDCHVDHIIPLQGANVSGLHVHTNLQILLATDNLSKGNKFSVSVI